MCLVGSGDRFSAKKNCTGQNIIEGFGTKSGSFIWGKIDLSLHNFRDRSRRGQDIINVGKVECPLI